MKLRSHHLICLQFFRGKGYNPAFVNNLTVIVERAEAGETIEVVAGPDDVCHACPYLTHNQCHHSKDGERGIRKLDQKVGSRLGVRTGDQLCWQEMQNRVWSATPACFLSCCEGCGWLDLCTEVRNTTTCHLPSSGIR